VLLTIQKLTDPGSGKIVAALSNSFFEPYGIKDGEIFLGSVSPNLVTVKYDDEDDVAVISRTNDPKTFNSAIDPETAKSPGSRIQISESGLENVNLLGNAETVAKCTQAHQSGKNLQKQPISGGSNDIPPIRTYGVDRDTAATLATILSERRSDDVSAASRYVVETRFNKNGMERRLVSEFGLIGAIITMLESDE
jgi:hypothetical protein